MTITILPQVLDFAPEDAFSMTASHKATLAVLMVGGRICTSNPDWLRRLLTRRGLAFATMDNDAGGTTFRLIP